MGLLSGALSYTRYKVLGELPADFRISFLEAIQRFALVENEKARTKEDNVGWVSVSDPGDTELDMNKCLVNHLLTLSMRVDRKRVPARFLRIVVDRRVKEVMATHGLERMSAARRREIKEAVEEELLSRSLPVVGTYDMLWDLNKQELWLFATSDILHDLFRGLFKDTFGLELHRMRLADWLQPARSVEELAALVEGLSPEQSWRG